MPIVRLLLTFLCSVLLFTRSFAAEGWIRFDLAQNPANALEGPLPASQDPAEAPEEVLSGELLRGPGLRAVYLAGGFGAAGWSGPEGGPVRYEDVITKGMYLEWSVSPRQGQVLQVMDVGGILRHNEREPGRLTEFEWQWSLDDFLHGPEGVLRFSLSDATRLGEGIHRIPPLDFGGMGGHPPLTGFQRLTVRLFAWDGEGFDGNGSPASILGWMQPPEGYALEVRLATSPADPWELTDSLPVPHLELVHIDDEPWLRLVRHPESTGFRVTLEESPDLSAWRPHRIRSIIDSPKAMYFRLPENFPTNE